MCCSMAEREELKHEFCGCCMEERNILMRNIIQLLMGMLGSTGFSVLFNVRGRKLLAAGAGAGISLGVYFFVLDLNNDKGLAILAATVTVGILAEVLARIMKTPVTILLVPMLIPLIPGSDLYYTTSYLIQDMGEEFAESLSLLVREAGAIAFGIILVTCVVQIIFKVIAYVNRQKRR